jgi:hypothetical protein
LVLGRRGGTWARRYNRAVAEPLNLDTSPEIERMQVEAWQQMSSAQKAAQVSGLTRAAVDMTLAGIRQRYPAASTREVRLRFAVLTLGPDLARAAFPDVDQLVL